VLLPRGTPRCCCGRTVTTSVGQASDAERRLEVVVETEQPDNEIIDIRCRRAHAGGSRGGPADDREQWSALRSRPFRAYKLDHAMAMPVRDEESANVLKSRSGRRGRVDGHTRADSSGGSVVDSALVEERNCYASGGYATAWIVLTGGASATCSPHGRGPINTGIERALWIAEVTVRKARADEY